MPSMAKRIVMKILALVYMISSLVVPINASAHSDLSKLRELRNSLASCQAAVFALQELITDTTVIETTTTFKFRNLTSPSTSTVNYPTDTTFPSNITDITNSEDPFPTTEVFLNNDTFEFINATGTEEFSSTTESIPPTDSTTELITLIGSTMSTANHSTKETLNSTEVTIADESTNSEREVPRIKRDAEKTSNTTDESHEFHDEDGGTWGISVLNVILSMHNLLQDISEDPFESEYATALDLKTNHLNELTMSGKEDKELVLASNWESLLNASREALSKLVAAKKVVKTEIKRATSTKMGTTAVICLVSILLAFVIIALMCVLLKPWRRCCKKKETASRRPSSSTTYSNYYRKTSALEGIRNFSYDATNEPEPTSALTISLATMSIPSISIPRPTVIRLSDRYQPSSATLRNGESRELEPDNQLQRSYLSYT